MRWEIVSGRTSVIDTPQALIPTYRLDSGELLLFDSGVRPDPALLADFEEQGLRVRAVLCTHLHPDHIANNTALVERYGTEIFSTAPERESHESWEKLPYPITFLDGKCSVTVDGAVIDILPTPGHSPGHLAYITPDGVCCVGDALMSSKVVQWSKLPYMEDVDRSIVSMEAIRNTRHPYYVAAHKGVVPLEEMPALVDENIRKELDLYDLLRQQIPGPKSRKEVLRDFMLAAGIQPQSHDTFFIRFTAKIRLDALVDAGEYYLKDGLVVPCK